MQELEKEIAEALSVHQQHADAITCNSKDKHDVRAEVDAAEKVWTGLDQQQLVNVFTERQMDGHTYWEVHS